MEYYQLTKLSLFTALASFALLYQLRFELAVLWSFVILAELQLAEGLEH
jgi:hypothetical protein